MCKFERKQTVFVYKAKNKVLSGYGEEAFGWRPSNVIDVFEVCMKKGWSDKAVEDQVARDVVGGQFCRRAWRFCADRVPSPVVMEHRKIFTSLIYEFGRKEMSCQARSRSQHVDVYAPMEEA